LEQQVSSESENFSDSFDTQKLKNSGAPDLKKKKKLNTALNSKSKIDWNLKY